VSLIHEFGGQVMMDLFGLIKPSVITIDIPVSTRKPTVANAWTSERPPWSDEKLGGLGGRESLSVGAEEWR
jgi:hypothetical protein